MSGSPFALRDVTTSSPGSPSQTLPESTQSCTPADDVLNTVTTSPYRVTDRGELVSPDRRYTVDQVIDGGWETIGYYADRVVADEIVHIACGDPDDDVRHDGESADRAVPFSALDGIGDWL